MRLAGPDVILFVVGLLLFSGAGYALVVQGGPGVLGQSGSPTGAYTVTFPLETVPVGEPAAAGDLASAQATFQVNATNVKTVIVQVECSDALPGGTFQLTVNVAGPNGLAGEPATGSCGSAVEVQVPVATPPESGLAQGDTEEEARANLAQDANATAAQGAWTVTVTGSRGAGPIPGLPAGNPGGSIVMSVERWEPELSPVQR